MTTIPVPWKFDLLINALESYARDELETGRPLEAIREDLIEQGWHLAAVGAALRAAAGGR